MLGRHCPHTGDPMVDKSSHLHGTNRKIREERKLEESCRQQCILRGVGLRIMERKAEVSEGHKSGDSERITPKLALVTSDMPH